MFCHDAVVYGRLDDPSTDVLTARCPQWVKMILCAITRWTYADVVHIVDSTKEYETAQLCYVRVAACGQRHLHKRSVCCLVPQVYELGRVIDTRRILCGHPRMF